VNASSLRYSAGHLLYAATLTATASALFSWYGVPISIFILIVWWQILAGARREATSETAMHSDCSSNLGRRGLAKPELLIVLLIVGLLMGLLMPGHSDADPMRHAEISMKMVAQALKEYHNEYNQFPPPVLFDNRDQPMHSWRALILPYLEDEALARAYRLDETWNSPHNSDLAKFRPWHFREYYPNQSACEFETSMHFVPLGDSLLLIELEELRCNWLEPSPIDDSEFIRFRDVPDVGSGYWHEGFFSSMHRGRLAVTASNTFQVHPSADLEEIKTSLKVAIDSKEPIEIGEAKRQFHFKNVFHLAFFLLVALYPLNWLRKINRICA
jgi:hypothetical protein